MPILDGLALARQTNPGNKGLKVFIDSLLQALDKYDIQKMETTVGHDFSPIEMEIISTRKGASGKVLEELQSGYRIFGKVARPANVIVGE